MKKIGILTMYYGSYNYGGLLQAYALCYYLKSIGYDAEQICFKTNQMYKDELIANSNKNGIRKVKQILKKPINHRIELRKQRIKQFREIEIPHSSRVYNEENINECNDIYDIFITGSDQVWNLNWLEHVYFLDFVKSDKLKVSYAASLGMETLSYEQRVILKDKLQDFKAISVREKEAIFLVKSCIDQKIIQVLDPTLLLGREQWDQLAIKKIVNEPYLFCYFLGDRKEVRRVAEQYAKKYSLKIVTIPYLSGYFRKCDLLFGDVKIYEIDPGGFISLIKNADCIMTDSFHATVFSNIYKKNFFVFQRYASGKMSSRVTSLLEIFENSERFCSCDKLINIKYMETIENIEFYDGGGTLKQLQHIAKDFLQGALK